MPTILPDFKQAVSTKEKPEVDLEKVSAPVVQQLEKLSSMFAAAGSTITAALYNLDDSNRSTELLNKTRAVT